MIERTFDYRIIKRLVTWPITISRECLYLLEKKEQEVEGVWSFNKHKDGVRIHADLGPKCRGKKAIDSAVNAFRWVFDHTPAKAIYAGIPTKNKPACQVAARAGMIPISGDQEFRWYELRRGEL